jgi:hypothetical protein
VQSKLAAIEARNQVELTRLSVENGKLLQENTNLKDAASATIGEERVSDRLEKYLKGLLKAKNRPDESKVT